MIQREAAPIFQARPFFEACDYVTVRAVRSVLCASAFQLEKLGDLVAWISAWLKFALSPPDARPTRGMMRRHTLQGPVRRESLCRSTIDPGYTP